jgi:tetratricopeptide (TPR) repeat protein
MDQRLFRRPNPRTASRNPAAEAEAAVRAGDLKSARKLLTQAVQREPTLSAHRFRLGLVYDALGKRDEAAECYCRTLSLDTKREDAARKLSDVLSRGRLADGTQLDHRGLTAALAHRTVDRDVVASAALYHLAAEAPMRALLRRGRTEGWTAAARDLLDGTSRSILSNPLLLAILSSGVIANDDVEALLTATRRALLLGGAAIDFGRSDLVEFTAALIRQIWLNEFVFAEDRDEAAAIDVLLAVPASYRSAADLARLLLYRSPEVVPKARMVESACVA